MKYLHCYYCDKRITEEDPGIKFYGKHYCDLGCLMAHISWDTEPIELDEFERYGEEDNEEEENKQ